MTFKYAAMLLSCLLFAFTASGNARAHNSTVPGRVSTPYPTITNLAVEWEIQGDDNLNAACEVKYRRAGESDWREAMPFVRVPAGETGTRTWPTYRWLNKFSGSILDLRPGTEYEIRLSLRDPDGGAADTTVRVSTRPVPAPAEDSRVIEANPRNFVELISCAEPGDVFVLTPGYYYGINKIERDGAPGRPIVIRGRGAHPTIGSTFHEGLDLTYRRHLIIENLTLWGSVDIRGAVDVTVRRCKVFAQYGIIAQYQPGARNCYIADNEVSWIMPWTGPGTGSSAPWGGAANLGEGIELTGPGNVIAFNRVSGFRDCISTMEDLWVYDQVCVDIYNNDITVGPDDGIEADFCGSNCRIMRNRIADCGMGLSAQPSLGGPVYFIRNVMYNITGAPFKLERHSVGNIFLHNTVVKVGHGFQAPHWQNEYFRTVWLNNLCIGGGRWNRLGRDDAPQGRAVYLPGFNSTCTFDYNAAGTHDSPFSAMFGDNRIYESLEELKKASGATRLIEVGMDVFAAEVPFPDPPMPERGHQDLRPAPGSAVVDAGLVIPNVNDSFSGKAPDIGAYELGEPLPHYGPRPEGVDELTEWERLHGGSR